ncbi:hypothetical protein BJ742DRAFT_874911 [Cladochytrium replicatum]|nr:hypothetical protein BJ742DRAFT_874911 [Cladochytrium replicatum]
MVDSIREESRNGADGEQKTDSNNGAHPQQLNASTTTTNTQQPQPANVLLHKLLHQNTVAQRTLLTALESDLSALYCGKRAIDKDMLRVERVVHSLEQAYLNDSAQSGGNIIAGLETILSDSVDPPSGKAVNVRESSPSTILVREECTRQPGDK